MKEIYCRRCGERLTSPRAIKWEEGQRCRWKRQEAEGTRVYRGPHMKEEDYSFVALFIIMVILWFSLLWEIGGLSKQIERLKE